MRNSQQRQMTDPEMDSISARLMTVLQNTLRRDTYVSLNAMAIVCEAIAADCRYNIWTVDVVKKQATEEQYMLLLEQYEALTDVCVNAVIRFHEDHDNNKLEIVVKSTAEQLNEIMKKGIPQTPF